MDSFYDTINKIISLEWDMFQAVNEGGPRASCQEDRFTFEGMRRGQFESWSKAACESYLDDLLNAVLDGRNLVTEKYIHMMKYSSPSQYSVLVQDIPCPDDETAQLARDISDKLLEQTISLIETYPYVSGSGRPLRSVSDLSGVTSIETYQLGELYTYSHQTLRLLMDHLQSLEEKGQSLARTILKNSVKHYGYRSLQEAEDATKERVERDGIKISFGCEGGEGCTLRL